MTEPLHDFYIMGTDGVVYKAIYALEDNFFLVCESNVTVNDLPTPVYMIRGEKVQDFEQ